ncbi:hypothetical protein K501DRAFT_218547 [Backusella circina FSU 941]|nr:hypothetical protein K501DRAFT_234157 [Backusella circina FSU 941]KAI8883883.1 hypothetical protein K501DRAFT_218547 [Backusella circina FSU 941]
MSEMKFMGHYDSDDDMEKQRAIPPYAQQRPYIPLERKKKRSCIDKMCCGCCTCCPKWLRWCTCFIFIILLIICIVIGVLAALFKVPEVSFTDPASPVVTHPSATSINISSSIAITVQNPNIEGLTFSMIKADAYYPSPYNVYIGGGEVDNVHIESKGVTQFTFPFSVLVDSQESGDQGAIMDLVTRCGLDGSTAKNIDLDLKIYPTVHIGVIPITPTISKSVSFPCPLKTEDISGLFGSGGL